MISLQQPAFGPCHGSLQQPVGRFADKARTGRRARGWPRPPRGGPGPGAYCESRLRVTITVTVTIRHGVDSGGVITVTAWPLS